MFMVALAVGTLAGSGILVLVPEVFNDIITIKYRKWSRIKVHVLLK